MSKGRGSFWVLVTGAASGIGRATAVAFADAGADLVLVDVDAAGLEAVREHIRVQGRQCIARTTDVSDATAMAELAGWVRQETGAAALDVLVNNAGIGFLGPFLDTPPEAWQRVLGVNLLGVVNGCRAFLPDMIRAGGKRRIVNVASLAGLVASPNMSAYAAVKHAVVGLGESLGLELELAGAQVGVTTVCPGIIRTGITAHRGNLAQSIDDAQHERLKSYYARKGVAPEVVADAIVRAVHAGTGLVLVGPFARPLYHLRRLSPRLARRLVLQDARSAGYI
jgi:NAD(P)-dependent dehydrogenase (short-subunit alcohol dehydrogenase family)